MKMIRFPKLLSLPSVSFALFGTLLCVGFTFLLSDSGSDRPGGGTPGVPVAGARFLQGGGEASGQQAPEGGEELSVSRAALLEPAEFAILSPKERALRFLQLVREDAGAAFRLLESSHAWLEGEREGLSAVFFEEIVREGSPEEAAGWLARLGAGDTEGGLVQYLLEGALGTPGLVGAPLEWLENLAVAGPREVTGAAQAEALLLTFRQDGFAAAVTRGAGYGIYSDPEDPKFELFIGEALQENPQEVVAWLTGEVPGSELADFYLPFALSQLSWSDYDQAVGWRESLGSRPPSGLEPGI